MIDDVIGGGEVIIITTRIPQVASIMDNLRTVLGTSKICP